jgi:hypothetical protein
MHECDRRCTLKNVTISPGKARKCEQFSFDTARELVKLKRAKSIRDRYEARQAAYREFLAGQKAKEAGEEVKHPKTGNLSRFKTT